MTTWSGWTEDFLAAASLPDTSQNRKFLNEWADNASSPDCADNPIDLSHTEPGSTDCAKSAGATGPVQAYTSHTWARTAFNSQIHSSDYPHLLAAFKSGDPYSVSYFFDVEGDLNGWGSGDFGNTYATAMQTPGSGSVAEPHTHKGWASFRQTFNHDLHSTLKDSEKARRRALQSLSRARKVKL